MKLDATHSTINSKTKVNILERFGGGGGIRTPGTLACSTVFKTVAFDHSATPPLNECYHKRIKYDAFSQLFQ